ncbi:Aryl-alcohol dehydrogenase [Cyphellophora attinorum]|uniref:Aryl-alcohol dehydrogenase n=1 Tax=Cyphellophora attinorum TaxID=1664694 RepID=A0A0N0NHQ7_9EURO|nr:Aryl-alcohol dehydrogenase [Phialophora attinorum]KPI34549.1 Aryl-alcohol dehydrogenase [Phialophora attinorum]
MASVTATAFIVHEKGGPFTETAVRLSQLRDDEVLVDLRATSICHTDLAVQHGKIPMQFPVVLGHEGAGVVREVGTAVSSYKPGDHVVLSYASCAQCRACLAKKPYQCETATLQQFGGKRLDGSSAITHVQDENGSWVPTDAFSTCFFGQSSFCNPAIVREVSCVKVPETLPLEVICTLGCGFQTGAGAVFNVVRPAERNIQHVAIFGVGAVGCAAVMAASHLRNTTGSQYHIIAIDINDERLAIAKELGATFTINSRSNNLLHELKAITSNGVDAAIDCTGVSEVVADMFSILSVGGVAVQVGGPPPGTKFALDVFDLLIKCQSYVGCHQGNSYSKEFIPQMAKLYSEGTFPIEKLQKQYPVRDIGRACAEMASGKVIKPVLLW